MSGTAAVDASLAVMWAVPEPHTADALDLAREWAAQNTRLIAPCLLLTEVTNAVYKRIRRREFGLDTARKALRIIFGFPLEIVEEPGLHEMALGLSARLNLPATYDGHYLALAERYDCVLWTGDQKLYRSVASGFARINWIGNRRDAGSPPAL